MASLAAGCGGDAASPPLVGTLERDRIEIIAEASEPIVALEVREGDHVAEGALLMRLETATATARPRRRHRARRRRATGSPNS